MFVVCSGGFTMKESRPRRRPRTGKRRPRNGRAVPHRKVRKRLPIAARRIAEHLGVPHATEAELRLRITHDIYNTATRIKSLYDLWHLLKIADSYVEDE